MKKALVAASLVGVSATAAHAQSSVTLYGLLDAGLTYSSNVRGASAWKASTGNVGSKWGVLGTENLGGGTKAIFKLENGFNIFNGMVQTGNNRLFGREAWVGLSSARYGALTLGRQYDSLVNYLGPIALTGTTYGAPPAAHPFDNDNLDNSFRVNNSVKYQSVNYGGFKFGALYGFSNKAGGFADNRVYSAGASYTYGPLNVAIAYLQLNSDVNAAPVNTGGAVTGDTVFTARRQRTFGAGLTYAFSPALTFGFVFTQTRLNNDVGIASTFTGLPANIDFTSNTVRFNNYEANLRYSVTPTLSVAGGYTFTDASFDDLSPKYHQLTLQVAYALSKRTDVFLQGEYQHVSGLSGTGLGAFISSVGMSSGPNAFFGAAGMRARF